ncbi:hypothetical protein GW575_09480 [Campylobacter sp. MIT 19-121]|uniref:hypothetical protein n=1 Tax=Campylobacter sp. MIT 19-121 TaxID=2703906 RepID=UPI001389E40A|nr:hypothetical protein [Campylobacter sp. MIT 19-121]NDJ28170.1 hypothetical protein [Campylobacter sp. MIT 19-121]
MSFLTKRSDDRASWLEFFHKFIIAFFCLIFFVACGYKGDPSYSVLDKNGSVKEIKPYKNLNRW